MLEVDVTEPGRVEFTGETEAVIVELVLTTEAVVKDKEFDAGVLLLVLIDLVAIPFVYMSRLYRCLLCTAERRHFLLAGAQVCDVGAILVMWDPFWSFSATFPAYLD